MGTVATAAAPAAARRLMEDLKPQAKARLAYTRKWGWVVVLQYSAKADIYSTRPGRVAVSPYEILGWADLPPVPETAA